MNQDDRVALTCLEQAGKLYGTTAWVRYAADNACRRNRADSGGLGRWRDCRSGSAFPSSRVGRFRRERAAHGSGPDAPSAFPPDPLEGEGRSGSGSVGWRSAHSLRLPDDHGGQHGAGPDPGQRQGRVPGGRVLRGQRRPALVAWHRLSAACIHGRLRHLDASVARRADAQNSPGRCRCRRDGLLRRHANLRAGAVRRLVFYGASQWRAHRAAYDKAVQITTPLPRALTGRCISGSP